MAKVQFTVPDMACSACAETITKAVQTIDASAAVDANPETKRVDIESGASDEQLKAAISEAGYSVQPLS